MGRWPTHARGGSAYLNRPGLRGGSNSREDGAMSKSPTYSPEVRERAIRMVLEHRGEHPSLWAAVQSIAPKIGCVPQTLYDWVRRHEVDQGLRDGVSTAERERVKELEREVRELRRANDTLTLASASFAQVELDRRLHPGAADAAAGPARCDARRGDTNHRAGCQRAVPPGPSQPTVQADRPSGGCRTSRTSRPGRAGCMGPSCR